MTEEKIATREEKLAPLIGRALGDAAFRKRLVESPKAVIAEEFGVELPDELKVEVLQESVSKLYIVLPQPPVEGELGDEELKAVAGGSCVSFTSQVSNTAAQSANTAFQPTAKGGKGGAGVTFNPGILGGNKNGW
jgi:hypothetical protein